ncbi:MAG: PHP domain-containing protein, partial [Actinomycetales bacterium]
MSFTHLHLASGYSFKYGTTLPEELVEHAAELGMDSIALTDRETLAGAIRFARSCELNSLKPVIGIDIESENKSRITLLATPGNWSSLVRLVTEMKNLNTPISFEFFKKYSKYSNNL